MGDNIVVKAVLGVTAGVALFAFSKAAGATQLAQLPQISASGKIATDGVNVYFADSGGCTASSCVGQIWRVPVSGGTPTSIAQGLSFPQDVAYAASKVFFSGGQGAIISSPLPTIGFVPVSGGPLTFLYTEAVGNEDRWVTADADGSRVYFASLQNSGAYFVYGMPATSGAAVMQLFTGSFSTTAPVAGLDIDPRFIYVIDSSQLAKADKLTGSMVLPGGVTIAPQPVAMNATSAESLAYASAGSPVGAHHGSVFQLNTIQSLWSDNQIEQGGDPSDIATDGECVYWTDSLGNQVMASPLFGGGGSTSVVYHDPSGRRPANLTLDISNVYFTMFDPSANTWTLQRVPKGCPGVTYLSCVQIPDTTEIGIYSTTSSVTVEADSNSTLTPVGGVGTGVIRFDTETLLGSANTPAAGLRGYEYHVDMTGVQANGVPGWPCVDGLSFPFGTPIRRDFNADGITDDCYVNTSGNPNTRLPTAVTISNNQINISFGKGVCVNQVGSFPIGMLGPGLPQMPTVTGATTSDETADASAVQVRVPTSSPSGPAAPASLWALLAAAIGVAGFRMLRPRASASA
jgi:hypothetical protein